MEIQTIAVAGVTFEGRQDVIAQMKGGEELKLIADPLNKYDPNAVQVHAKLGEDWKQVGFLPREIAAQMPWAVLARTKVGLIEITGGYKGRHLGLLIQLETEDAENKG